MSLYNVGRICVKLAGRDAGEKCVVLSEAKDGRVLIGGATRRREVNVNHLEPLNETVSVKVGASDSDLSKVLEPLGIKVRVTKAKKVADRPKHMKKVKAKEVKKAAPKKEVKAKKPAKKEEAKKVEVETSKEEVNSEAKKE